MSEQNIFEAIKSSIRRVRWIGIITIGFPPWFYSGLVLGLALRLHWKGMNLHNPTVEKFVANSCIAACLVAPLLAMLAQIFLSRRVYMRFKNPVDQAPNLSAVGIVSLTIAHTPAVMGLLYFIILGALWISLSMELWALVIYLPIQFWVERYIRRVESHSSHG